MPSQEVAKLAALANDAAARTPNDVQELVAAIRAAIASPADPLHVGGVLIEGLAQIIGSIPTERRRDCGLAAVQMVIWRVRAVGGG
jgi:hypothetical protein